MGGVRGEAAVRDANVAMWCCGVEGTETDRDVTTGAAVPGKCACDCTCTGRGSPGSAVPDLPRLSPTDSRNGAAVDVSGLVDDSTDEETGGDTLRNLVCVAVGVTGGAGDSSSTASDDRNLTVDATAPHQPDDCGAVAEGELT